MRFYKQFLAPDKDHGEWREVVVPGVTDLLAAEKRPAALVRRMPDTMARRIEGAHLGRKQRVTWKRGGEMGIDSDSVKSAEINLEKAIWCLIDVRNWEHQVGDDEAAAQWRTALGDGVVVAVGQDFPLDGLLSENAKRLWFQDYKDGVDVVLKIAGSLAAEVRLDDEGKD